MDDEVQHPVHAGTEPTPIGGILRRLRRSEDWSDEQRDEVLRELFHDGAERREHLFRFSALMVLSSTIAAFGLLSNSAAVVIGAMLIAPLMTPILAVAASLALAEARRLVISLLDLVAGTLAAVATAWLVSALTPGTATAAELTQELLARTAPSILDLGIAVAAGLAAGYVLTHPAAGSSLPGVAIAVALVPPLATVGIALELGAGDEMQGALLLYATNITAIVLSAMVVMLLSGFVPIDTLSRARGRVRLGLVVSGMAVAGVAVPLAIHTFEVIEDQQFTRTVLSQVDVWDPAGEVVSVSADVGESRASVEVVLASASDPAPAWRLAELLTDRLGLPVDVEVQYRLEQRDAATAG